MADLYENYQRDGYQQDFQTEISDQASNLICSSLKAARTHQIYDASTHSLIERPATPEIETPKIFKCVQSQCNKIFASLKALKKHKIVHGPLIHICKVCEKGFNENSKLRRHMLVHTDEKKYQCPFEGCGKRFKLDFNLKTHSRIHTGERPFECPSCSKKFRQKANMKSHYLRIHLKKESLFIVVPAEIQQNFKYED